MAKYYKAINRNSKKEWIVTEEQKQDIENNPQFLNKYRFVFHEEVRDDKVKPVGVQLPLEANKEAKK